MKQMMQNNPGKWQPNSYMCTTFMWLSVEYHRKSREFSLNKQDNPKQWAHNRKIATLPLLIDKLNSDRNWIPEVSSKMQRQKKKVGGGGGRGKKGGKEHTLFQQIYRPLFGFIFLQTLRTISALSKNSSSVLKIVFFVLCVFFKIKETTYFSYFCFIATKVCVGLGDPEGFWIQVLFQPMADSSRSKRVWKNRK